MTYALNPIREWLITHIMSMPPLYQYNKWFLKCNISRQENSSVSKALAAQTRGPVLNSLNPHKKSHMVAYTYNPSARDVEKGGSLRLSKLASIAELVSFRSMRNLVSKKVHSVTDDYTQGCRPASTCMHTCHKK